VVTAQQALPARPDQGGEVGEGLLVGVVERTEDRHLGAVAAGPPVGLGERRVVRAQGRPHGVVEDVVAHQRRACR
jgi:hypothetical protein